MLRVMSMLKVMLRMMLKVLKVVLKVLMVVIVIKKGMMTSVGRPLTMSLKGQSVFSLVTVQRRRR